MGTGIAELDSLVSTGQRAVPFFWVSEVDFDAFEEAVTGTLAAEEPVQVAPHEGRAL